jgi:Transposase, Mutator family
MIVSGRLWVEGEGETLDSKHEGFEHDVKLDVEARVRQRVLKPSLRRSSPPGGPSTLKPATANLPLPQARRAQREDGARAGQGVRRTLRFSLSEGRLRFRGGHRGRPVTYLRYPRSHHARIRTTNMLERLFGEVKRRTPGEKPGRASWEGGRYRGRTA